MEPAQPPGPRGWYSEPALSISQQGGGLEKGMGPEEAGRPDPVTLPLGHRLFAPSLPRGLNSPRWESCF